MIEAFTYLLILALDEHREVTRKHVIDFVIRVLPVHYKTVIVQSPAEAERNLDLAVAYLHKKLGCVTSDANKIRAGTDCDFTELKKRFREYTRLSKMPLSFALKVIEEAYQLYW